MGLGEGIFSLGSHCNSTGILKVSNKWDIIQKTANNHTGRTTIITITNKTQTKTLVNVYAPTNNTDRIHFYENLTQELNTVQGDIIIGGDFNITLEDRDITGDNIGTEKHGRVELQTLIDTLKLKDSYREVHTHQHTTNTTHTIRAVNRSVRLDRFYVSENDKVTQCKHLEQALDFTDHKAVIIKINANFQQKRHSPHWKFNNSLL